MEIHIKIIGSLLVILALIHFIFPSYFNWKKELSNLSLINKQMMYVHTFFIALTVFLMGILCISSAKELVETPLGQKVSLGFGLFWITRLFIQFFGYDSKLWRGKKLESIIHILFSILWTYMSFIFLTVYWASKNG